MENIKLLEILYNSRYTIIKLIIATKKKNKKKCCFACKIYEMMLKINLLICNTNYWLNVDFYKTNNYVAFCKNVQFAIEQNCRVYK